MTPPLYFVNHPGRDKASSLLAYLAEAGVTEPRLVTAILFIADGTHLYAYGRGLYGETWYRAYDHPCETVRGVVVDSLQGTPLDPAAPRRFVRDRVSVSDLRAVDDARADLATAVAQCAEAGDAATRIAVLKGLDGPIRQSRLWRDGEPGTPLDLLTPIRDRFGEAGAEDQAFVIRHASY